MTMTLREQIRQIAEETFTLAFSECVRFPQQVDILAVEAFMRQWSESTKTRAIRRAALLLHNDSGIVSLDEPAVE